jgi:hypothetical protein
MGLSSEDRNKVRSNISLIVNHISEQSIYRIIYFHSNITGFHNAPLGVLRLLSVQLGNQIISKMKEISIVHPTIYLKTRFIFNKKQLNKTGSWAKMKYFDKITTLLETVDNYQIRQKITSVFPMEISNIYKMEKEKLNRKATKKQLSSSPTKKQGAIDDQDLLKQLSTLKVSTHGSTS